MSVKKWLVLAPAVVLILTTAAYAIANALIDPYGVFGDPIFDWYGYNETNNPGVAKLAWLERHHEEFDSYVIGSSSASSYNVEELNEYLDAKFYNLFIYNRDAKIYGELASYILENYEVKNLILSIGISEAARYDDERNDLSERTHALASGENILAFYLKYAFIPFKESWKKYQNYKNDTELPQDFDIFDESTGLYDDRFRDVEKIGDMDRYMSEHGDDFNVDSGGGGLPYIDECVKTVADIRDMCGERGVNLIVISSPEYYGERSKYNESELRQYKTALAEEIDFWDFSAAYPSYDERYFYDAEHFRNAVGSMVLAEIFENDDVWRPDDFGAYVTSENRGDYLDGLFDENVKADVSQYTIEVPTLMYHHFDSQPNDSTAVTPERFEEHIRALSDAGYTAVSTEEMINYVYWGGDLPEKSVCVTMDDGYLSNYETAAPILEKYGMKGTVFAIGSSVGHKEFYKDTEYRLTPHFGYDEAREMEKSGILSVQSHTYDMHQWAPFETGDKIRKDATPIESDDDESYAKALLEDIEKYDSERKRELGEGFIALSYPGGRYTVYSEYLIHKAGIKLTFSSDTDRRNVLVRGLPQSLYALCRYNITENMTGEDVLALLER